MTEIPRPDGLDVDIGARYLQVSWTLYSVAAVVVILRLYAQGRILRQLGLGDALMVLSWIFGTLSCIFLTVAYHYGFGRHFFYLTPAERVNAQRAIYINEPLSIMGSATGRLAFMVLMYRIFGTTKYRRWFIIFLMAQTLILNLLTAITIFTQCSNVNTLWDPDGVPGVCWSPLVQEYIGYFQSSCNSATDLVLTIMPGYLFWNLHMGLKTKLGLICLMCLSIFAFVASLIKAILLGSLGARSDYTFNTVAFFTWISVENTLVIIAASVPMIRPIFARPGSKHPTYELNSHSRGHSRGAKGYALSSGRRIAEVNSSSEENILPMQKQSGSKVILKRMDYTVTYDEETGREIRHTEWAGSKV